MRTGRGQPPLSGSACRTPLSRDRSRSDLPPASITCFGTGARSGAAWSRYGPIRQCNDLHAIPVSYQVNWEIQALDQTAGFLRDDPMRYATKPTLSVAWTGTSSSTSPPGSARPRAARPTSATSCGSPPKPTPSGSQPTPRPSTTTRCGQRHSSCRTAGRRTPTPRSRKRSIRAMVRRHPSASRSFCSAST